MWNVRRLLQLVAPPNFPAHLVRELVRREALGHLHDPERFLEVVWPFKADADDNLEWDPLSAVLCRAPGVTGPRQVGEATTMAAKLEWFQSLLFSDFVAMQFKSREGGLQPLRRLALAAGTRLEGQGTKAGVTALAPGEARLLWEDCVRCVTFVGAMVEEAAMTADQVAALSEVDFERPKTVGQKVLASCGKDPFWQQQVKQAWRRGAVEAAIGPKMQGIIAQVQRPGPSAAAAWKTAQDRAPCPPAVGNTFW